MLQNDLMHHIFCAAEFSNYVFSFFYHYNNIKKIIRLNINAKNMKQNGLIVNIIEVHIFNWNCSFIILLSVNDRYNKVQLSWIQPFLGNHDLNE